MANIMVVDDDLEVCRMLKELFESEGHVVQFAVDPGHMYTMLAAFKPDLLVLDMQMPGGGGPFAKKVVDNAKGLGEARILFHSNMPIAHMKDWFPPTERHAYLQKGAPLADILGIVRALLGKT